ncbi:MAG: hypothetical protein Q4A75_03170 [Peptostreptococcaceae bacterium]|nr:hypothetical protein [Peptostreptococcaceae bacterium]
MYRSDREVLVVYIGYTVHLLREKEGQRENIPDGGAVRGNIPNDRCRDGKDRSGISIILLSYGYERSVLRKRSNEAVAKQIGPHLSKNSIKRIVVRALSFRVRI